MGAACAGETGRTGASSVPPREADAAGVMRVSGTPLNGAGAGSSSNTKGAGRAGCAGRAGAAGRWKEKSSNGSPGSVSPGTAGSSPPRKSKSSFCIPANGSSSAGCFSTGCCAGDVFFTGTSSGSKPGPEKKSVVGTKTPPFQNSKPGAKRPPARAAQGARRPDAAFQLWHYFTASRTHTQARRAKKPLFSAKYEEFLNFPKRDLQFSAVWCMLN